MTRDWDAYWLERARLNATMSTCRRRHVGAVATRDRRSFADGFNGNLPGVMHCDDGGCPVCLDNELNRAPSNTGIGRCLCVHAEQNLVAFCASEGIRLSGATVYSTTQPCLDCVKLLISCHVKEIVFDEEYPQEQLIAVPGMIIRRFGE